MLWFQARETDKSKRASQREMGDAEVDMPLGKFSSCGELAMARGMTLVELTVVILVILSLISVLFISGVKYKDGADQANCILNIRMVQQATRSWQNVNNVPADGETPIDEDAIYGDGKYLPFRPVCPSNGNYTFESIVPLPNDPVLTCDIEGHEPNRTTNW